jgi:hypothetical protein
VDQIKVALSLGAAVTDGRQQTRVMRGESRQLLGIVAVVLTLAGGDGPDLARVGHQHLMAELLQHPADPSGMRAALQSDTHLRFALEVTAQGRFRGLDAAGLDHLTVPVEHAVLTEAVPKIETYGNRWLFHWRGKFDSLLHRLVSSCTSSACGQIKPASRDQPSHPI